MAGECTDTEKLSAPARALVKAIRRRSDGSVEVVFHNRLDASDQLNRMQGVYVDRSVSLNLNADIKPLPKGMSIEEALAIMESVSPTQDALPSPTSSVVSEQ
jgi:hypothetical protein